MNYEQVSQLMMAAHIYADVNPAEYNALEVNHFMIHEDGICYIGTDVPVAALQDKELINPAI